MGAPDWLQNWKELLPQTIFYKVIPAFLVALSIEVLIWMVGRLIEHRLAPFMAGQRGRSSSWQVRRRARLRAMPRNASRIGLDLLGLIWILHIFRAPMIPICTWFTVTSVVIVMGARRWIEDVISGYLLLLDDHLAEGEQIQTLGANGSIERLTLRTTHIRAADGTLHVITNRDIRHAILPQASNHQTAGTRQDLK